MMKQDKTKNDYSVILDKVGNQPLMTMKIIMRVCKMGLGEAKTLIQQTPSTISTKMNLQQAIALKDELEALGNQISIPGMEIIKSPIAIKETSSKKQTPKKKRPSSLHTQVPTNCEFDAIFESTSINLETPKPCELTQALMKVYELVGREGFKKKDRVCHLLSDLIPKMIKERRRIQKAYEANAIAILIEEDNPSFAINEATKRFVDYCDMDERIAKETILTISEVLNKKRLEGCR